MIFQKIGTNLFVVSDGGRIMMKVEAEKKRGRKKRVAPVGLVGYCVKEKQEEMCARQQLNERQIVSITMHGGTRR